MYQFCSVLGAQGPRVGSWVPPDSEIHVVAIQNLIERIIFSHSEPMMIFDLQKFFEIPML